MTEKKTKRHTAPYSEALSLVTGALSLVISSSYFLEDDRGWQEAAWAFGFGVLAVLNLASFLGRIVPWVVHTAELHRPTR